MPAMRTRSKASSLSPIKVVEFDSISLPVLSSWTNNSSWVRVKKYIFYIIGLSNNKGSEDSSVISKLQVKSLRHLDSSFSIISSLEVIKSYPS
jgi:hypothetical protein